MKNRRESEQERRLIDQHVPEASISYRDQRHHDAESEQDVAVSWRAKFSLALLVFINLINYMDRLTIAGVLPEIKSYFHLDNTEAGLLQTIFTCSYMVFAPIFGYLGDRFPRKYVISFGICIWSAMTLSGSYMDDKQVVWFFVLRGLVGIGEASYSTVAPTIIGDIFVGDSRTKALSLFYFAIPCGGGLGYIVGSKAADLMNSWRWALRVTPGFGLLSSILCVMILHEPERGAVEINALHGEGASVSHGMKQSSKYFDDLKYLGKVRSFVWATVGTTLVSFVVGGLSFWAPTFITDSQSKMGKEVKSDQISFIVGIITFVAGLTGVLAGAEISRKLKIHYRNAEALVCAYGIICGAPLLFGALFSADKSVNVSWVLIFVAEVSLCLYWVPNADLRLAVIVPNRRATAEAIQILTQHLLGDASSPFIIGAISDSIRHTSKSEQTPLLLALYITPFLSVLGAAAYLFCSLHLIHDKEREVIAVMELEIESNPHYSNET